MSSPLRSVYGVPAPIAPACARDPEQSGELRLRESGLQARSAMGERGSTEVRLLRPALISRTPSRTSSQTSRLAPRRVSARPVSFLSFSNSSFSRFRKLMLRLWRIHVKRSGQAGLAQIRRSVSDHRAPLDRNRSTETPSKQCHRDKHAVTRKSMSPQTIAHYGATARRGGQVKGAAPAGPTTLL